MYRLFPAASFHVYPQQIIPSSRTSPRFGSFMLSEDGAACLLRQNKKSRPDFSKRDSVQLVDYEQII